MIVMMPMLIVSLICCIAGSFPHSVQSPLENGMGSNTMADLFPV